MDSRDLERVKKTKVDQMKKNRIQVLLVLFSGAVTAAACVATIPTPCADEGWISNTFAGVTYTCWASQAYVQGCDSSAASGSDDFRTGAEWCTSSCTWYPEDPNGGTPQMISHSSWVNNCTAGPIACTGGGTGSW